MCARCPRGGNSVYVDSFEAGPTVTRKTQYANFREAVIRAGRFSAFEATANKYAAGLYTRLCRDPEVETDISCGYPWTLVRRKGERQ